MYNNSPTTPIADDRDQCDKWFALFISSSSMMIIVVKKINYHHKWCLHVTEQH